MGYKNYDRKPAVQGKSPFFAFFSVGGGNIKSKSKKEAFIFILFILLDDNYLLRFVVVPVRFVCIGL
ncbi:hypothetical protein C3B47_14395 [Flavobacterium columnare]|nr:hypothetical protein [Flavobacterium columnare]